MQTAQTRNNPLLTVAAISVIVLSAVGVAALTGMIPTSKGQENALELPKEVARPIEPAISAPAGAQTRCAQRAAHGRSAATAGCPTRETGAARSATSAWSNRCAK